MMEGDEEKPNTGQAHNEPSLLESGPSEAQTYLRHTEACYVEN